MNGLDVLLSLIGLAFAGLILLLGWVLHGDEK